MYPRYFKRLLANWIESKSQRIVFEFIHKARNPISRLVFPRRGTMISVSFLEKRENVVRRNQSIAQEEQQVSRWSNRGGGRAQDVAWRMLPSLRKFPIRHRSSRFSSFRDTENGMHSRLFILYNKFAQWSSLCVLLQISLESRSNRVERYGFRNSISTIEN